MGFQIRGPRVALWKLRSRLLRLGVKGILWLAAISGIAHWILWVIFEQPYLLQTLSGRRQGPCSFTLISCTTLFAWGFTKSRKARRRAGKSRLISPMLAIGCWGTADRCMGSLDSLGFFSNSRSSDCGGNPLPRWGKLCSSWAGSQPHMRCFRHSDDPENDGGRVRWIQWYSKRAGGVSRWLAWSG